MKQVVSKDRVMKKDSPLRVRAEIVQALLNNPEFQNVSDSDLIYRAQVHLGLAQPSPLRGIAVRDRVMAIAVLLGMPDKTCGTLLPSPALISHHPNK